MSDSSRVRGREIDFTYGDLAIVITDDGSHTLYHQGLDETYHSLSGALNESLHVFIRAGLLHRLKGPLEKSSSLNVLEIGWGTGLNTLLTMERAMGYEVKIHYLGLDPHPLPEEVFSRINYSQFLDKSVSHFFPDIHQWEAGTTHQLSSRFSFQKIYKRFVDWSNQDIKRYIDSVGKIDLVYFDAFGMGKHSEPWQESNFIRLAQMMACGGLLVTYASHRLLKQGLEKQGLKVEIIPGSPPKREMTRATQV